MLAYTTGALFITIGLLLGVGLAAYALWYIFVKLNR